MATSTTRSDRAAKFTRTDVGVSMPPGQGDELDGGTFFCILSVNSGKTQDLFGSSSMTPTHSMTQTP